MKCRSFWRSASRKNETWLATRISSEPSLHALLPGPMGRTRGAPPPSCPRFLQLSLLLKKIHPWPATPLPRKVYILACFCNGFFPCDSLSGQLIHPLQFFPCTFLSSTPLLEHPVPCSQIPTEEKSRVSTQVCSHNAPPQAIRKLLAPTKES